MIEINRTRRKIMRDVGQRLRQLRSKWGWAPKDLASRLGVETVSYYKNENGESLPNPGSLVRMHKELGVSMDWLLCGSGPMFYEEKAREAQRESAQEEKLSAWEELMPDAGELLDQMTKDRLLRHKVLLFFYEHKKQQETAEQQARQPEPPPEPDRE